MPPADEISKANVDEINEAITYAFARAALRDALNDGIEATGTLAWHDDTDGCLRESLEDFNTWWTELRAGNCDLFDTAARSILNALAEGIQDQLDREGGEYAPAVWRHVKANLGRIMKLHSVTIADDTVCGEIWDTTCILVECYLDEGLPDETVENWEREIASWPK